MPFLSFSVEENGWGKKIKNETENYAMAATSLLEHPFTGNHHSSLLIPTHAAFNFPNRGRTTYFIPPLRSPVSATAVCLCAAGEIVEPPTDAVEAPQEGGAGRDRRKIVRVAWEKLVRWSRSWRSRAKTDVLERTNKVDIFLVFAFWLCSRVK